MNKTLFLSSVLLVVSLLLIWESYSSLQNSYVESSMVKRARYLVEHPQDCSKGSDYVVNQDRDRRLQLLGALTCAAYQTGRRDGSKEILDQIVASRKGN